MTGKQLDELAPAKARCSEFSVTVKDTVEENISLVRAQFKGVILSGVVQTAKRVSQGLWG